MLKSFANLFNKNIKSFQHKSCRFNFTRKFIKKPDVLFTDAERESNEIKESKEGKDGKDEQGMSVGIFPYLPINDHPLIPGFIRSVLTSGELIDKMNNLKLNKKQVVVSALRNPDKVEALQTKDKTEAPFYIPDVTKVEEIYDVGCLCELGFAEKSELEPIVLIRPLNVCKIIEFTINPSPIGEVKATIYPESNLKESDVDMETSVKFNYLRSQLRRVLDVSKDQFFKALLINIVKQYDMNIIDHVIWSCASILVMPGSLHKYGFLLTKFKSKDVQDVLEELDSKIRLEKTLAAFSEFTSKVDLWEKLENEHDAKTQRSKATEKLKSIFESLKNLFEQETDEKNIQVQRFKKNLEGKTVPEHILKIIEEELERFISIDKHSMESNVIRNYLDVLTSLPYGISTEENLDIEKAREIINETHYGMEDIKERILEAIAVGKLKGKIQGKILCFVGPPGVGKTSIGESIAKALNRKFIRISLGGDRDTSSIKGHRRTYVGAIPGKIIKALKTAGSENPLILLDEIDKLAERSLHGDPSSVLLEVLDPEQNHSFTDDYLDTPVDLSKVFFLCTANSVSNIQQALFDRMEIIEVSGYTFNEKKFIFQKYLQPKSIKNSGLDTQDNTKFCIEEDSVNKLINDYCRESGVRSLQRYTNRIYEKIALKLVQGESDIRVTVDNLKKFVGNAHFSSKRVYDKVPKGVSIGLGFNTYGGTILYVEANKANYSEKTTGQYNFTGNVGKVMGESCNIGLTYAKFFLNTYLCNYTSENKLVRTFFDENHIHIHFTEGAIAKDGPSAGVTIATALISLALNKPILQNLAMTGELTLGGVVLAIGGVKEKVMAAQREGMKTLIFPLANKDDVEELPEYIKQGLSFHYAESYIDVFRICHPDISLDHI